ncbi:hypothetical protein KKF63_10200 [bacterium]|nr:hypothetical protein [bacterium]
MPEAQPWGGHGTVVDNPGSGVGIRDMRFASSVDDVLGAQTRSEVETRLNQLHERDFNLLWHDVPLEFQKMLTPEPQGYLPKGIHIPIQTCVLIYESYTQMSESERLPLDLLDNPSSPQMQTDLKDKVKYLGRIITLLMTQYGYTTLDVENIMYTGLYELIALGKTDYVDKTYDQLDAIGNQYQIKNLVSDREDFLSQYMLRQEEIERCDEEIAVLTSDINYLSSQNGSWYDPFDEHTGIQVAQKTSELRKKLDTRRSYVVGAQDITSEMNLIQKEIHAKQYFVLKRMGADENQINEFLIKLGDQPESIPGHLEARVKRLRQERADTLEDGSVEQLVLKGLFQDALTTAVANFNAKSKPKGIIDAIERAMSGIGEDDQAYIYSGGPLYVDLDNLSEPESVPELVRHPPTGWMPVQVGAPSGMDGWVFVQENSDGEYVIRNYNPAGTTVLRERVTTNGQLIEDENMDQEYQDLERAINANPHFTKIQELGNDVMLQLQPVQQFFQTAATSHASIGAVESLKTWVMGPKKPGSQERDEAQGFEVYWLSTKHELLPALESGRQSIQALQKLIACKYDGNELDIKLKQLSAYIDKIEQLISNRYIEKLIAQVKDKKFSPDTFERWASTEGLIIFCAVVGAVTAMMLVPYLAAGIGLIIMSAEGTLTVTGALFMSSIGAAGGLVGQEVGLGASGKYFDTGLESSFEQWVDGDMTGGELAQTYGKQWLASAASQFLFMYGGSQIAGRLVPRLLASGDPLQKAVGQILYHCGAPIDKLFGTGQIDTRLKKYIFEVVSEYIQELIENGAERYNTVLGKLTILLNCISVTNAAFPTVNFGATDADGTVHLWYDYTAEYDADLVEGLEERAIAAKKKGETHDIHVGPDGTITVTIESVSEVEGETSRVVQTYSPSQTPIGIREAMTGRGSLEQLGLVYDPSIKSYHVFNAVKGSDPQELVSQLRLRGFFATVTEVDGESVISATMLGGEQGLAFHIAFSEDVSLENPASQDTHVPPTFRAAAANPADQDTVVEEAVAASSRETSGVSDSSLDSISDPVVRQEVAEYLSFLNSLSRSSSAPSVLQVGDKVHYTSMSSVQEYTIIAIDQETQSMTIWDGHASRTLSTEFAGLFTALGKVYALRQTLTQSDLTREQRQTVYDLVLQNYHKRTHEIAQNGDEEYAYELLMRYKNVQALLAPLVDYDDNHYFYRTRTVAHWDQPNLAGRTYWFDADQNNVYSGDDHVYFRVSLEDMRRMGVLENDLGAQAAGNAIILDHVFDSNLAEYVEVLDGTTGEWVSGSDYVAQQATPTTFNHETELEIRGLCEADAERVGADIVIAGDTPSVETVLASNRALYSYGYMNCRGIIMVQGNKCAMTHIHMDADADPFIFSMLEHFNNSEPIQVFLLEAAGHEYSSNLQEQCEELGLHVSKKFIRTDNTCSHCLLVDPQTGQVIHYDKAGRHSYALDGTLSSDSSVYTDISLEPTEEAQEDYRSHLEFLHGHMQPEQDTVDVGIQVDDITSFRGEFFTQAVKEVLGDSGVTQVQLTVHDAKTGQDISCTVDVAKGVLVKTESPELSLEQAQEICAQVLGEEFTHVQKTVASWDQAYQNNFWQAAAKYYQRSSSASLSATPTIGKGTSLRVINPITAAEIKTELQTFTEQTHEFITSLQAPIEQGGHFRRVNASKAEVIAFIENYSERPADFDQHGTEAVFQDAQGNPQTYFMPTWVLAKFDAWVLQQSHNVTTEVKGFFVTEMRDGVLIIVDFLPKASLSESVEYRRDQLARTHGKEIADKRIGESQIDSLDKPSNPFVQEVIGFEAFNPLHDSQYKPEGLCIPVHNHFLDSEYQSSPSVTDWKGRKSVEAVRTPKGGLIFYRRGGVVGQDQAIVVDQTIEGVATEAQIEGAVQFATNPRIVAGFNQQTRQAAQGLDTEFEVWQNVNTGEIRVLSGDQGRADTGSDVLAMSDDADVGIETETQTQTNEAQNAFDRDEGWVYRGHAHPVGDGYTVEPSADDILRFMQEGLTEHYIFQHDSNTGETHWACLHYDTQGEVVVSFSQEALISEEARTRFQTNRTTALTELESDPELRAPAAQTKQQTYKEGDRVFVEGYESFGAFRVDGVFNGRVIVVADAGLSLMMDPKYIYQDEQAINTYKQEQLLNQLRELPEGDTLTFDNGRLYFTFVSGQLYVHNPAEQSGIIIMTKQGMITYEHGECIQRGQKLDMDGEWLAVSPGDQMVLEDMRFALPTHLSNKKTLESVLAATTTEPVVSGQQQTVIPATSQSDAETTQFFRLSPTASTTLTLNPEQRADIHAGNVHFTEKAKMPNGEKLTFETLQEMGITPRTQLDIEGREAWISKMFTIDDDGRVGTIAYVKMDDGSWAVRSFYKSKSHVGWRVLTHYTRNAMLDKPGWYGKGYTSDSVMLPISAQHALYEALNAQKEEGYALEATPEDVNNVFAGTARAFGIDMPLSEGHVPDMTFVMDVSQLPEMLDPNCFPQKGRKQPDPRTVYPGATANSNLEPADFTKPDYGFDIDVPMYGHVHGEAFTSRDGSLRYLFFKDDYGRVWIGSIEKTDVAVGSHGVHTKWVDGGALVTPAFEYYQGRNKEIDDQYANTALQEDGYVDTFDKYLRHVPLIQRYYREKGQAMPTSESLRNTPQESANP